MFHGLRDLSAVILDQAGGTTADGFGLGAEEAGRANEAFQFGRGDFGKVFGCSAALKKRRGDLVDPFIRALGREDRGHEKLKRVGVIQLAVGGGVGAFELGNDLAGPARKMG